MNHIVLALTRKFEDKADPVRAIQQKAYMRNQFEFFGIGSPERSVVFREIFAAAKSISQAEIEEIIDETWSLPQREYQYFGMELANRHIKKMNLHFFEQIELMITCKSWWDTVDMIAAHLAGTLFFQFPGLIPEYTGKWMTSGNMWLQRSALLFQLSYKSKTNPDLLFNLIQQLSAHSDFFIRKAIGWALREYSKTNPKAVIDFVDKHQLSSLSKKEAFKWITAKKYYLGLI